MKSSFAILWVLFSQVLVFAQPDQGVADAKPAFEEVFKKMNARIRSSFVKNGRERGLKDLERVAETLMKDYPEELRPYQMLLAVGKMSNGGKKTQIYKQLSTLAAREEVPPLIARQMKGLVELNKVMATPNEEEKYKALERLSVVGTEDSYPALVTSAARREWNKIKFARETIGKPLAMKFEALGGREVDLSKMKGKVVLIDFWATWCGPGVKEIPSIKKLYDKYQGRGFEVVGISLDSDRVKLEAFIDKNGMGWPQFFDGKGWSNRLAKEYGIRSISTLWLVDKEGNLVDLKAGSNL